MKTIGMRRLAAASLFAVAIAASAIAGGGVESRMFELRYADATEVAANFNRTWHGEAALTNDSWVVGEIAVPFVEANSVMVTAPEPILDACAKMVEYVDRKPKQVYIEARFVELGNTAMFNLGLDWSSLSGFGVYGNVGGAISKQRIPDNITKYSQDYKARSSGASESYEFSKGGMADNSYFYGTLSTDQMKIVLMAFQGSQDFKTFSNPKVIVTSGKEATVDMTTKRPNVTLSAKRVLNGNNNTLDIDAKMIEIPGRDSLMFAHEAFFSWGVTLNVQPRVMTNGLINVSIVPTISSLKEYVRAESSESDEIPAPEFPIIDIQRIVTEFTLKDGQTAVIGGLSRTIENDVDGGIPYLSNIPWIGDKLFGGKTRAKEQREIVVFVTVGLSDPDNVPTDAGLPKNAVLGRTYTDGTRQEPGDRKNAVEGVQSLDLRALEDRASETKRE